MSFYFIRLSRLSGLAAMLCVAGFAQSAHRPPVVITQAINETNRVSLGGNVRPEANAANDIGPVAADFSMDHMLLQLQRSPQQEEALEQFIDDLHNPASPNYHQWLTPQQFGQQYGLAQQDLNTITSWLTSRGLTVNSVYPNGLLIDFSGTAGAVQAAFRTAIHEYKINGRTRIANASNPQIPAALASAISGVVSLNNFKPHRMNHLKPQYSFSYQGTPYQAVVPADLAKIYNFTPLFNSGTTGSGQTVVVIEDADLYSAADWQTFQSTFGLSQYKGKLVQAHPAPPSGVTNCQDPGTGDGDDVETAIDAEWALAAAPGATIEVASCRTTRTTFGGLIALQNILNASNANTGPAIVSISYGECEAENGASSNAAYNSAYQQAVALGISVFVSAGDEGAASCDAGSTQGATHGISVSAFATTKYNVAVGGTDFGDTYAGANNSYWSGSNGSYFESAKSYVPEIPWNDSCASRAIAAYAGYSTTYGTDGFCNSSIAIQDDLQAVAGGGGGPSGCFTGTPSKPGVVSGTCAGTAKPSWQAVLGNPGDGVRDIPDVSLFASNGGWGHFYVSCFSDTANGGAACTGAPSNWTGAGGTSFASPIMAGLQALVNQKHGRQGNPNTVYYQLASHEYGSSGSQSCLSSNGSGAGSSCIFYDITSWGIDQACTGTINCYDASATPAAGHGRYGVLSTSDSSYEPAFGTNTGWDFATGIGTVNAANLVNNWPK